MRTPLGVLAVISLAVPVGAYAWVVHQYSLNVIYADNWDDIRLISHSYAGLSLSQLWAVHGENRILFPNLIVLALAHTTHFNVAFEEYLNAILLLVATGLIVLAHKRRSHLSPWIAYAPVVFLLLSFVQGHSAIWGFQLSWYLVLVSLAGTLILLDQPRLSRFAFVGAIATAVVGSYSSLQGLVIWPSALVLLWLRARTRGLVIAWIVAGSLTFALFFYNFHTEQGDLAYVVHHLVEAAAFYLFIVGDVIGLQAPPSGHFGNPAVTVLGAVILGIATWCVVHYATRRDPSDPAAIGVAIIVFGLVCAALITVGRLSYGPSVALRYAPFELLVWVGCYLCLLSNPVPTSTGRRRRSSVAAIRVVLAMAICLQIILGTVWGLKSLRVWHQIAINAGAVAANIGTAPDQLVVSSLYPNPYLSGEYLRALAGQAEIHKLSLFDTDLHVERRLGLPIGRTLPSTSVVLPRSGTLVRGTVTLLAAASGLSETSGVYLDFGVSAVQFVLVAGGRRPVLVSATNTEFGWLGLWNSQTVPDGSLSIRSVVHTGTGRSGASAPIIVTVTN